MLQLEWKATAVARHPPHPGPLPRGGEGDSRGAAPALPSPLPLAGGAGGGWVGRVEGTREMVVRSNYIVVYAEDADTVTVLRVLHAAQQWPQT